MLKMLNIAMIVDTYDVKAGGIVSTHRFTEALRKRGHKVIVISTGCHEKDKVVLKEYYPPFAKTIMKKMKMVFATPDEKKIKEVFDKVDLVHIQLPFYLGIKSITYAREKHLPIVTSFHVQAENLTKNISINSRRIISLIYKFFISKFYNRSDLVICPSVFAQKELKHFGLKIDNIIISNGKPEDFYPQKAKRKYQNKFVILTVGRLSAEKNQKIIIDAISKSKYAKEIQLIINGFGPLKDELKKQGKILPNKPLFLENQPIKKLINLYNTSDLYIHAGQIELEGMTVLEAISCGLVPIIANESKSASPQFALNNKSLFNDVNDLTQKIDYWYEHQNELSQAKEKYFELSKKYTINESINKLENAYLKAIEINKTKHKHIVESKENGTSWYGFLKYFYTKIKPNKK